MVNYDQSFGPVLLNSKLEPLSTARWGSLLFQVSITMKSTRSALKVCAICAASNEGKTQRHLDRALACWFVLPAK